MNMSFIQRIIAGKLFRICKISDFFSGIQQEIFKTKKTTTLPSCGSENTF
jgi:hypothetical protein